ncbi:MAG: ACT domain-containing protein [Anaerolineaceae bacterium]|nr:ACT domain-containing protein [Anaerolineaceae bacterium]
MTPLTLQLFPEKYLVCRFSANTQAANIWLPMEGFWSLTYTPDEVSLVMQAGNVLPEGAVIEEDWRMFRVAGTLAFEIVGVLSELSKVLANAEVSIFALSTYDTDYLLVKSAQLEPSLDALRLAGYGIENWQPSSLLIDQADA